METFQQFAAVCLVIGLAALAAYVSRKAKGGALFANRLRAGGTQRLRIVERLIVTPQHSICIVRIDEREVIVGLHGAGMILLDASVASPAVRGER